jgi:hypothetical protein
MNYDMNSSVNRMISQLRSGQNWAEVLPESANMRLVEMVGSEVDHLAQHFEKLFIETKWDEARNRSSLMKQVKAKGYTPHRKIGARGQVALSVSSVAFSDVWKSYIAYSKDDHVNFGGQIYKNLTNSSFNRSPLDFPDEWLMVATNPLSLIGIPKYTELSSKSGLSYTTISAANYSTNQNSVLVDVVQGVKKSISYLSVGAVFEEFTIQASDVDNFSFELFVDGELWLVIDDIRKAEINEKRYQILDSYDFSSITIRFGNGDSGKKLLENQQVSFVYIATDGDAGSVSVKGEINSVKSSLYSMDGKSVRLVASNLNSIAGGKDHESVEEIRQNAVKFFQSGDQLLKNSDYEIFLKTNFNFIGNSIVWGAYELNLDAGRDLWSFVPSEENLIYISAYTTGDQPLDILKNLDGTDNFTYKTAIMKGIRERKPITDVVKFVPVVFIYLAFTVRAFVSSSDYLLSEVVSSIRERIYDEYNITKMSFKKSLFETNYKRFIDEIPGVEHHNTTIQLFNIVSFTSGGSGLSYRVDTLLPIKNLKPRTILIKIRDTTDGGFITVAEDNGSGELVGAPGFVLDSISSVNYTQGLISLSVDSGLSKPMEVYELKLYYETEALDVKLSERNQILYLKEVENITAEYIEL